jgi:hypothetical protein
MDKKESPRKAEPEFKLDLLTILWLIIGSIVSWINMILINNSPSSIEVISYLSIIFTTMVPTVGIGLKNRFWAYGYILGFSIAGIPYMILIDLFIGGYTFATSLFIFIIMWLIFWKAWRSLSSISVS